MLRGNPKNQKKKKKKKKKNTTHTEIHGPDNSLCCQAKTMSLRMLTVCFLAAAEALQMPVRMAPSATRAAPAPRMEMSEAAAAERIKAMVGGNKVFLFMKGNKLFPQCGFSNTAIQILNTCNVEYETFDVLSDMAIRDGVKK